MNTSSLWKSGLEVMLLLEGKIFRLGEKKLFRLKQNFLHIKNV